MHLYGVILFGHKKNHVLEAYLMAWKNVDNILLNDILQKVIKLNKEHELFNWR